MTGLEYMCDSLLDNQPGNFGFSRSEVGKNMQKHAKTRKEVRHFGIEERFVKGAGSPGHLG